MKTKPIKEVIEFKHIPTPPHIIRTMYDMKKIHDEMWDKILIRNKRI